MKLASQQKIAMEECPECLCLKTVSFKSSEITINVDMCAEHKYDRSVDLAKGTILLSSYIQEEDVTTVTREGVVTTIVKEERKMVECTQLRIDTVENLLNFMQMELVDNYLKGIMSGANYSIRHELFHIPDQRWKCNGLELSHLHRWSNPTYLSYQDIMAITYLKDVIKTNEELLSPELRGMDDNMVFLYASTVLLPDILIYNLTLKGLDKEQAEQKFVKITIDEDERQQLRKEMEQYASVQTDISTSDDWIDYESETSLDKMLPTAITDDCKELEPDSDSDWGLFSPMQDDRCSTPIQEHLGNQVVSTDNEEEYILELNVSGALY